MKPITVRDAMKDLRTKQVFLNRLIQVSEECGADGVPVFTFFSLDAMHDVREAENIATYAAMRRMTH